jgi:hypothetical protein
VRLEFGHLARVVKAVFVLFVAYIIATVLNGLLGV